MAAGVMRVSNGAPARQGSCLGGGEGAQAVLEGGRLGAQGLQLGGVCGRAARQLSALAAQGAYLGSLALRDICQLRYQRLLLLWSMKRRMR